MVGTGTVEFMNFPTNVLVIGGGRWSRVLVGVLCELAPPAVNLFVHSPSNAAAMSEWASMRGIGTRLKVSSFFPGQLAGASSAIIVANAACDHEMSVERALCLGAPVLVEKPIALNFSSARRLAELARMQNARLAAANVFLFAGYVERFSKIVAESPGLRSVRVRWSDPRTEIRHGEAKSYDPALPVYADWLPHIISVLTALAGSRPIRCKKVNVMRGGAELEIDLMLGTTPCSIALARNGSSRKRRFEVEAGRNIATLDFSEEPGTIGLDSTSECADPCWASHPKPVSRMLTAFLEGASSGVWDDRLDVSIGLRACDVIEQVSHLYRTALLPWLSQRLLAGENDDDLRYALSEILLSEDPHSKVALAEKIEYVFHKIRMRASPFSQNGSLSDDPVGVLRSIAQQM